jgi:DNA polymerase III subunit alpha
LGLYLTGHPLNRYRRELKRFASAKIADINSEKPPASGGERGFYSARTGSVVGYVHEIRKRGTRTSALLDDRTGRIEVSFTDEVLQQYRDLIVKDAILLVEGSLRYDEFSAGWRLNAKRLLNWPRNAPEKLMDKLAGILRANRGGHTEITLRYGNDAGRADLDFGPEWRVHANRDLVEALQLLLGSDGVDIVFGPPASSGAALASSALAP